MIYTLTDFTKDAVYKQFFTLEIYYYNTLFSENQRKVFLFIIEGICVEKKDQNLFRLYYNGRKKDKNGRWKIFRFGMKLEKLGFSNLMAN